MPKISPFLWYDHQAEDAATLYTTVFPNSKVTSVQRYGPAGPGPEGSVMVVQFELDGQQYTALNGGPANYNFNESVSFVVDCADQAEVDHYWETLTADGGRPSQCGWLVDKFGVSWQVVPVQLDQIMSRPDAEGVARAMAAMLTMGKLDVAALEAAYDGSS